MRKFILVAVAFIAGAALVLASLRFVALPFSNARKIEARIGRYQMHNGMTETFSSLSGTVVKSNEVFLLDTTTGQTYVLGPATGGNIAQYEWHIVAPGNVFYFDR